MEFNKKIKLELPSHIKNALSDLHAFRKEVDLIVHVIDARSVRWTDISEDLKELFPGLKILNIVSKSDLIDSSVENGFDFRDSKNRRRILELIKSKVDSKIDSFKKLGYKPHIQILVVGLPNVGKSTLINLLKSKNVAASENKPGVTRKIIKHYLGDNLWLYDSPGIFMNKNSKKEFLDKLFLLNSIPANINNYSELLERAFNYLQVHYLKHLQKMTKFGFKNYQEFILSLAKSMNFKIRGGEWDTARAEAKFLNILREGKFRISWDLC